MMFISIYYAPLHLALGRPHTIIVLALPYLLFHFFWNNHKHFFDYGSTTRNSMRNLSIGSLPAKPIGERLKDGTHKVDRAPIV
ncbi:hypothetical protein R3W88_024375 [Solanum pinnatisectum]|uniref:Protein TIC 214 n=1 Tax=Solanum pinnatisectum TaxID=50273 RepID=A0AAV9M1X0_9SOLN|nr:hypothetical protein R3W88_024375 [Solanum pinnatisectum]